RQRILDAMTMLMRNSKKGDFAIVYMSGHGSYQPDQSDGPDRDEEDGVDEVFLPYDVEISSPDGTATAIKNAIIDDEFGKFSDAIRAKGVDLWFVLDSCFSGTGMRGLGQARAKFIDPADLGVRAERGPGAKVTLNFGEPSQSNSQSRSVAETRGRAAFLYASQADEKSAEVPLPLSVSRNRATWRSAFTHGMVMALARQPKLTYRQ